METSPLETGTFSPLTPASSAIEDPCRREVRLGEERWEEERWGTVRCEEERCVDVSWEEWKVGD